MIIPPWSYSSLTKYETCPRQYQLTRVTKVVQDAPNEASIWGNEVHEALEARVRDGTPLPETLQKYERYAAKFDKFRGSDKAQLVVEQQMALTRNLQPCDWMASDCWCRGIIDVGVGVGIKASLWDWKTGKVKPDSDQLKLFAAFHMQTYKHIESVDTGFIWLAYGKTSQEAYSRKDLPVIWEAFAVRARRLENAFEKDKWLPKPSGLCRGWCPAGRAHCEFWCPKKANK